MTRRRCSRCRPGSAPRGRDRRCPDRAEGADRAGSARLLHASAEVEGHNRRLCRGPNLGGAPATLANYALLGWLLGMQRAGWALSACSWFSMAPTSSSTSCFVIGFGWGVGVGVASASAMRRVDRRLGGVGLLLVARLTGGGLERPMVRGRDSANAAQFRRLVGVNARHHESALLCLITVFAIFTNRGARQGDTGAGGQHAIPAAVPTGSWPMPSI